jgi:ATP phosphoribosyltransferase
MSLVLALPSKGRLKEQTEAWLADAGFGLEMEGGARGYRATLKGLAGAEVRLLSAGDIAQALEAGEAHLGVTGEDLLRERGPAAQRRVRSPRPRAGWTCRPWPTWRRSPTTTSPGAADAFASPPSTST